MAIRRVELGNELYDHAPLIDRAIPTPEAYGRKATRWIRAIKRRFPHARVAAVGLGSSLWWPPRTRRGRWDPGVLSTLRGEDALTFHTYWKPPRGRLSRARLSKVLAAPLRRLFQLRSGGLRLLPDGVVAWVTEWNVWHGSPLLRDMGERPLRRRVPAGAAGRAPGAPGGPPRAHQPHSHSQPCSPTRRGSAPTSRRRFRSRPRRWGGSSARCIRCCRAALGVRQLTFKDAPRIQGTRFAAIQAVAIQGRGVLLLNLDRAQASRPAGRRAPRATGPWTRSGRGRSARITGHAGEISHQAVGVRGPLSLPPYSVNRLDC